MWSGNHPMVLGQMGGLKNSAGIRHIRSKLVDDIRHWSGTNPLNFQPSGLNRVVGQPPHDIGPNGPAKNRLAGIWPVRPKLCGNIRYWLNTNPWNFGPSSLNHVVGQPSHGKIRPNEPGKNSTGIRPIRLKPGGGFRHWPSTNPWNFEPSSSNHMFGHQGSINFP